MRTAEKDKKRNSEENLSSERLRFTIFNDHRDHPNPSQRKGLEMTPEQIKSAALEIIRKAEFTVLTTIDEEGYPESRAMINLREGGLLPFFSTNTSSRKIGQIAKCPRGNAFFAANHEWKGVTLIGGLVLVNDDPTRKSLWKADWTMYYPGGVNDPDYSVIRLLPRRIVLYYMMDKQILDL